MHLTFIDRFLWAATWLGHAALLFVLVFHRRVKTFPAFTTMVAYRIFTSASLYFVLNYLPFSWYRNGYWCNAIGDEVLQLVVLYELAVHTFRPAGEWASDVRTTLLWITAASVGIALALSWLAQPPTPAAIQTFILRSNFFSAALMSELFVGMIWLSATAGLPWKTHVARIAQGLGAYSLFCVAKDIAVNYFGVVHHAQLYTQLSHLRIVAATVCIGFWIVMLWKEAPAPRELPRELLMQIYTLQSRVENDLTRIRAWRRS